ncbi:MAG TPA: tetratricopeptide repeat protein [Acidimicrobiales bacterium]|nr:tetratricopeptide repeat protein [Acidimicrobiales bacterium]
MAPPPRDRRRGSGEREAAKRAVARGRAKGAPAEKEPPKQWGGVARRGARVVGERREGTASDAWREAVARGRQDQERRTTPPPAWEPEVWVVERDPQPARSPRPPRSNGAPARRPRKLPDDVSSELTKVAGPTRSARLEQALADAARAYERDRYQDARRILKPLAERAPAAAAVRELHGLTLYRMGRWREAIKELEAFRALTGSCDQHPVLADCHRALRQWTTVGRLWEELRQASPSGEVVTEGRIVMAGAMADRGDIGAAIALLERARTDVKRPKLHHLRLWYALADLYERAGEIPRARELFRRVLAHDREFADVAERLAGLD